MGSSGVGKTTLLHLLGGLDRPNSGEIFYHGESLAKRSSNELADFRNRSIGFVFQFHYLLPEFTALENVAMPLLIRGGTKKNVFAKSKELLHSVGLADRLRHRPTELSGGEQQRVAIARALVAEPALLLADEPTGNLDLDTAKAVVEVLLDVTRDDQRGLIIVTHNYEIARSADRVLRMLDGKLVVEANLP